MRIGIYGGSFNPVHCGHVGIARRAIAGLALDRLLVIPAATSPFKTDAPDAVLSPELRLDLVKAAFSEIPKVEIDERELRKGGVSYAIDTVREIAAENPGAKLFFIVGEDAAEGLPRWKDSALLMRLCTFKAYPRTIESSTEIRRRIAAGEEICGLVPPEVERMLLASFGGAADGPSSSLS